MRRADIPAVGQLCKTCFVRLSRRRRRQRLYRKPPNHRADFGLLVALLSILAARLRYLRLSRRLTSATVAATAATAAAVAPSAVASSAVSGAFSSSGVPLYSWVLPTLPQQDAVRHAFSVRIVACTRLLKHVLLDARRLCRQYAR